MMDFVTHLPQTSRGHEAMWVIVDRLTKSARFFGCADDLHFEGILEVVYMGDSLVTWSISIHSFESGSSFMAHLWKSFQRVMGT